MFFCVNTHVQNQSAWGHFDHFFSPHKTNSFVELSEKMVKKANMLKLSKHIIIFLNAKNNVGYFDVPILKQSISFQIF